MRDDTLARRLHEAFAELHGTFATLLRQPGQSLEAEAPDAGGPDAEATASLLVSVLIGYVTQLATLPPGTADRVPSAVTGLGETRGARWRQAGRA